MTRRVLWWGIGAVGKTAACGISAAAIVFVLVVAAGGGRLPCGTPREAREAPFATFWGWLAGLVGPGMGQTWSCHTLGPIAWMSARMCLQVAGVLVVVLAAAGAWSYLDVRRGRACGEEEQSIAAALFMAPPVLWATVLTVVTNLTIWWLAGFTSLEPSEWLLPDGNPAVKQVASVLVLCLGAGVIWDLRCRFRSTLVRVLNEDFVVMARANGLRVGGRVARNLAGPILTTLVGKYPLLLGEVIVVEYVFVQDGIGRALAEMVELRDASALMAVTGVFVVTTVLLRAGVDLVSAYLMPRIREEVSW